MGDRGDLLDAIKAGKKLKKTVTNDRSAPLVGGGPRSVNAPPPPSGLSKASPGPPQRLPGIGGLFGDGGVPKLRPTGPSIRSGRDWSRHPPEPRKGPLPIPVKKSEAPPPPPPPLGVKPSFPSRTRSFNTGKSPSSSLGGSHLAKDDSRLPPSAPRTLKPPNHPPPPPPIPKRLPGASAGRETEETGSFEARFGSLFKPISSFPPPEPFTSIQKTYPSRINARKAASRS